MYKSSKYNPMKIDHMVVRKNDVIVEEYYILTSMKNDISSDFTLRLTIKQYEELQKLLLKF